VVCYWGYLELTPVAILAPPGMASAPMRLYNMMHYGHNYILSAMTLLAMAAPVVLLAIALWAGRIAARSGLLLRS
jgi:ABC-type Fe3+ transport system permease subunit